MKKNMGSIDRSLRIILAILFGILFFSGAVTGTWGTILLLLGIIFLLTSLFGVCPLYIPFKISTCRRNQGA